VRTRPLSKPIPISELNPEDQTIAGNVYDRIFWLSYIANVLLVTANAMTFRFAEFVKEFGGTESIAGFIVSCGVVSALFGRLFLGQAIDRFGVRRLWLMVASIFILGCVLLAISDGIGFSLYAGRVGFAVGLAGMFTCSIFHVQHRAPVHRRTEVIGNLGSSGFLGMIAGSLMCDMMGRQFGGRAESIVAFGLVGGLGLVYLLLVLAITRRDTHERPRATPPAHRLMFRYWPGSVAFVGMLMGMYFIIPSVYLTRFSTHRGLGGIGTYWTSYAITAFAFRVVTRRWSQTVGRHRMILMGITGQFAGLLLMPMVTTPWALVFPAVCSGFGHALLFPAVVSLGTEAFPREYRGTGTTLVLGFFDMGGALSAPALGAIIDHFGGVGFAQMYYLSASLSVIVAAVYLWNGARISDTELQSTGLVRGEITNSGTVEISDDHPYSTRLTAPVDASDPVIESR
jgi:MFS family permease